MEDRFSGLPDSILCHILSFLPMRDAVRTKILSTSLNGLLLHFKRIQINHNVHPQMVPFVNKVLESEAGPLTHFLLESEHLPESPVLNLWLNVVLSRTTKVVHIVHLPAGNFTEFRIPPELFLSNTLEDLKVCGSGFVIFFPGFAHCPNLKVLHLKFLGYVVGDKVGTMICAKELRFDDKSYPLLGNLDLEMGSGTAELNISTATLKRLRLTISSYGANVKISTPQLQHFDFMVSPNWVAEGQKMMSLGELQFRKCQSLLSATIGQFSTAREFMDFLMRINNVKTLHYLEHSQLDIHYLAADVLRFPNLTHLKLTNASGQSARFFRDRAPNLETFDAEDHGTNLQG